MPRAIESPAKESEELEALEGCDAALALRPPLLEPECQNRSNATVECAGQALVKAGVNHLSLRVPGSCAVSDSESIARDVPVSREQACSGHLFLYLLARRCRHLGGEREGRRASSTGCRLHPLCVVAKEERRAADEGISERGEREEEEDSRTNTLHRVVLLLLPAGGAGAGARAEAH
eukprot:1118486-Rhodomonas_salina.2